MSLINDALKRTHQAQAAAPLPPPDTSAAPLHPAESPLRQPWRWFWYAAALMLAALLASWAILIGVLANRDLHREQPVLARDVQAQPVAQAVPEVAMPIPPAPVPVPMATVAPSYSVDEPAAVANSANPLGAVATAPTETAPPPTPTFKLQGIFYRRTNPSAMINSKMVMRGDRVLNARVITITPDKVTLDRDGEKLVLTLP